MFPWQVLEAIRAWREEQGLGFGDGDDWVWLESKLLVSASTYENGRKCMRQVSYAPRPPGRQRTVPSDADMTALADAFFPADISLIVPPQMSTTAVRQLIEGPRQSVFSGNRLLRGSSQGHD